MSESEGGEFRIGRLALSSDDMLIVKVRGPLSREACAAIAAQFKSSLGFSGTVTVIDASVDFFVLGRSPDGRNEREAAERSDSP